MNLEEPPYKDIVVESTLSGMYCVNGVPGDSKIYVIHNYTNQELINITCCLELRFISQESYEQPTVY